MRKRIIKYFFILLFSNMYCQNRNFEEYERVYIEVGSIIPLDELSNQYDTSVDFGFWYRTKFEKKKFIDFGFNFYIPKNSKPFNFIENDSVFKLKQTDFSGMIGFKYCKILALSKKKNSVSLEWINTFGYAFIFYNPENDRYYDIKNGTTKDKDGNSKSYSRTLETFHIAEGLCLNIDNIGIQFQYQYTPFSLTNKKIETNFGSQSIILGIIYKQ